MLHTPVLLKEALEGLEINPDGIYIDATFGRGGHTKEILAKLNSATGKCISFDTDADAESFAKQNLTNKNFMFVRDVFQTMQQNISELGLAGKINGVLFDVGVSSPQLDNSERGFSFLNDGPLDMRMDNTKGKSVQEVLARIPEKQLSHLIRNFGEERFSGRIARVICEQRQIKPLSRTRELVEIIEKIIPFREKHKHPATRTFQALRIYVNDELNALRQGLEAAFNVLQPLGRIVVITFHSIEYQIVKQFIHSKINQGIHHSIPLTQDMIKPSIRIICKGKAPSAAEIDLNVRSRSAKITILEKTEY